MMQIRIRHWLKNEHVRVLVISAVLAVLLILLRGTSGILQNISDLLFIMGAVHIVAGGARYIRNVGLFKTFSYMAYKKRWKQHGRADGELQPMSLAEYTVNVIMDEKRQRPVLFPLCTGTALCVLSFLLALRGPWI